MSYWKNIVIRRFKTLIETDFGDSWSNLSKAVEFSTIEEILVNKNKSTDQAEKVRAQIIYSPLFFKQDLIFNLDKLPSSLKRSIRQPKYLLCIFTDYPTLKSWLNLLPIFKLIPIFIVSSKGNLIESMNHGIDGEAGNIEEMFRTIPDALKSFDGRESGSEHASP